MLSTEPAEEFGPKGFRVNGLSDCRCASDKTDLLGVWATGPIADAEPPDPPLEMLVAKQLFKLPKASCSSNEPVVDESVVVLWLDAAGPRYCSGGAAGAFARFGSTIPSILSRFRSSWNAPS